MRLFRYLTEKFAIEAIEERRLKVGRLHQLNDPYDCFPAISDVPEGIDSPEFREGFEAEVLRMMSRHIGLISFCSTFNDPVVWSHYADDHKGVALEFEIPQNTPQLERVKYQEEREHLSFPELKLDTLKNAICILPKIISAFTVKATNWSYEKEYRQFLLLSECIPARGHYFWKFPLSQLSSVIVGAKSDADSYYFAHLLKMHQFETVDVKKAGRGSQKYEIIAQSVSLPEAHPPI